VAHDSETVLQQRMQADGMGDPQVSALLRPFGKDRAWDVLSDAV